VTRSIAAKKLLRQAREAPETLHPDTLASLKSIWSEPEEEYPPVIPDSVYETYCLMSDWLKDRNDPNWHPTETEHKDQRSNVARNFFADTAKMVRKSGMVIVVWLAALVIAIIGGVYFVEDYQTSVRGYEMLPTKHQYPWIIWIGALTPQAGQVFFAYLGADDEKRWWAWLATAALFLVDSGTDVLFKYIPGTDWSLAATTADVLIMYTLCSEAFLVLGMGMVIELLPDAVRAARELKHRLSTSHGGLGGAWGMLGSQPPPSPSNRPGRASRPPSARSRW